MIKIPTTTPPATPVILKAEGETGVKGESSQQLSQGRVVLATVIEGGQGRIVLEIGQQRFVAESKLPFQVGQKLDVLVVKTAPEFIFQIMRDTLQARILNSLHLLNGQWNNDVLTGQAAKGEAAELPQLSPRATEALKGWLSYLRDPASSPFKGNEIKDLPSNMGLTLEKDLAAGQKPLLTLKNALLEAVQSLAVNERETGRQVLLQLGERIGEGSRLFQALPPAIREAVRAWFAARPDPQTVALKPELGAMKSETIPVKSQVAVPLDGRPVVGTEGRPTVRASDLRHFLKLDDLRGLANRLGLDLEGPSGLRQPEIAAQFKNAMAEVAVRLSEGEGELARQVGVQVRQLIEGGAGAARQYAPESTSRLSNWLTLVNNPPDRLFNDIELKFLVHVLGLGAGKTDSGPNSQSQLSFPPLSMGNVLHEAAAQITADKEKLSQELGVFLRKMVDEGGGFLKQLSPEIRQALSSVLTFTYEPMAPSLKDEDLGLLATLLRFRMQPPAMAGKQSVLLLQDALREAAAQLQEDKGGLLKDISRQLQQVELFQFSQVKLDQQNLYFMPLPLPFLEQGYLLADRDPQADEGGAKKTQNISLYLRLERLGDMQVDISRGEEGLFLRFVFDAPEKAEFAAAFQSELEEALAPFSLHSVSFIAGAEKPADALISRLVSEGEGGLDTKV